MAVEVTDKDKVTRLLPEVSEVGTYVRAQVSLERDRATQTEQALSARISEEQEARTQSDLEIRESITKEESRAKGSEEQLAQSITAERARAEQAESELDSAISVEKGRAQQVESDLQANLTSLSQDLHTEIARASNQEDALQVDIDNERSRAKGAESEIKNSVSAEISRATGVESGLDTRISGIEAKIPNQASASNQLADKDFVNSSINSSAAFYRGSFNTKADLDVWQTANPSVASNNDYAYVQADETHSNEAWRYIFVKEGAEQGQWQAQFRVNEAPLTSEQVAALNSGATKDLIDSIPHKLPINTEQTNFDEVYVKTAQGTQDSLPISKGADDDTIAMRGTGGTLKVGTPLVDKDAVPKDYAEKTFAGLSKQNSFTARNLFYKALEVYTSGGSEACKYDYGKIDYQVLEDGNLVTKTITLPKATGTMALLSDIPTNHVTTDTEQSITATKTFIGNKLKVQSSSSVYAMYNATQVYLVSGDQTTAYNIDTISRSKGGDPGNTYFYTFPNKSGTFAMLSDIGVDTIYGYLQGTNGISIAKTLEGDKVEVKLSDGGFTLLDTQNTGGSAYNGKVVVKSRLVEVSNNDFESDHAALECDEANAYLRIDDAGGHAKYGVDSDGPLERVTNKHFLTEGNVKTIGGQSIYGSGDIPISGGTIDADTLNGLLSSGNGITITQDIANDKVGVNVDPRYITFGQSIDINATGEATEIYITDDPTVGFYEFTNDHAGEICYNFNGSNETTVLQAGPKGNVKTIGGQSIYGSGDISVGKNYKHYLEIEFVHNTSSDAATIYMTDINYASGDISDASGFVNACFPVQESPTYSPKYHEATGFYGSTPIVAIKYTASKIYAVTTTGEKEITPSIGMWLITDYVVDVSTNMKPVTA